MASILLSLRSVFAFVVAKVDYISSGVYVTPSQYEPIAVDFRHTFRSILGLPKWTGAEFYALPLVCGGAGCPSSPLRPLLQLLKTYQQASYCRNTLARRAVCTLLTVPSAYVEGTCLTEAARSVGLQVHVLSTPFLRPTPLRIQGTLSLWHSHRTPMVSTDGAYRPGAIGGGIIFYAPGVGLLATVSFGCLVLGCTSAHAEWYAKMVALHLLGDWVGTLVFMSDATAIQQHSYNTYPPKQTPLETLYRLAAPLLSRCTVRELWHRAAHDNTEQELNFARNRLAHAAATAGLSDPTSLPALAPPPAPAQGVLRCPTVSRWYWSHCRGWTECILSQCKTNTSSTGTLPACSPQPASSCSSWSRALGARRS